MIYDEIRAILFHYWDPIMVSPNPSLIDEYDNIIPEIYRSIRNGATVEALAQILEASEREIDTYVDGTVRLQVAEKLHALTGRLKG